MIFTSSMRFAAFLILCVLSLNVWSATYSGIISMGSNGTQFTDSTTKATYSLTSATPLIATYINKLNSGDFISVDGTLNSQKTNITINSLNYVGLSVILGTWMGNDFYFYDFSSYTEFSISKKIDHNSYVRSNYTYIVNPTANSWNVLISGTYGSYVASLNIYSDKAAEIELYDSETGDILKTVQLRK